MTFTPLTSPPKLMSAIELSDSAEPLIQWVESRLSIGGYLPTDQVNGIAGQNTFKALSEFKDQFFLEFPTLIGQSTVDALAALEPPHAITEQAESRLTVDVAAGSKTGKKIKLPVLGDRFLNEWICEGSYLTFYEFTHGGTRIPTTKAQVENMIAFAKVFGWCREKYGGALGGTSFFRPPALNKRIGGAPNGWHPKAGAGDIFPLDGNFPKLLAIIKASPAGGIGLGYPTRGKHFYHVDVGSRRYWKY